jgi:hypothetical protein
MNKEIINQVKKTMDAAKKCQKCQIKFCKTQREQSEKKAKIMQKDLTKLPSKNLPIKKLLIEMNKLKIKFFESNETEKLGICTIENCEKELKVSFNELVNMYKLGKTPESQQKYKEGKKILSKDLNIKEYVNFLKATL